MADTKISALTTTTSLTGAELIPLVQSGNTVNASVATIANQLPASGVTAGSYTNANITVNAKGQVTAAANGTGGGGGGISALTGDVTASGTGSVATTLASTGVTAGTYTNPSLVVDGKGRILSASSGAAGITAITGDVTASGGGSVSSTLTASGVTAGSYTNANITVDAKGRVTSAASGTGGSGSASPDPTYGAFRAISSATSDTAGATDNTISWQSAAAAKAQTIPGATSSNKGKIYTIADGNGTASSSKPIAISPTSGTIQLGGSISLVNPFNSVTIQSDGVGNYVVI